MSFPRYPLFRNSGVQWLGEVPAHWTVAPLRRFAQMKTGHTPSRQVPEYWENCTIPWFGLADVWQIRDDRRKYLTATKEFISELGLANSAAELLPAGTVVLSRTASVGYSGIMPVPMATTQDFWNWICGPDLMPEYLLYELRAMRPEFERLTMGSTHSTIYQPDAAALRVCVPPISEQRTIVEFLDHEVQRIDVLMAAQQRLIALLQEKRRSVISYGLVGGDANDVTARNTACADMSRLPPGWSARRMKYIVLPVTGIQMGPFGGMLLDLSATDTGYKVYGQQNTIAGDFSLGERWITQERFEALVGYELRVGDLVLTRKGSLGNARLVAELPSRGIIDSDTIRIRAREDTVLPELLQLALHEASYVEHQIGLTRRGAILAGLNSETVANLVIAVPPITEQRALLSRLRSETSALDAGIAACEKAVGLLQERRTALIFAAVTGQIDVRSYARTEAVAA